MEYQDKVRWLRRYQDSLRRERDLLLEVERLRAEATRVTPALSGMRGGTADGQALPRAVERILKAQNRLNQQIDAGIDVRAEIMATITAITPELHRSILWQRYVLGHRWERIAADNNKDLRWIFRIHRAAINKLTIESH